MTDTLPLWRQAREFLIYLFGLFHGPEVVVSHGVLMRREARLMASWLRSMEMILRRLLLIEAAALPVPELAAPRARSARERRIVTQDPDDPASWHVRFRLIEMPARGKARARERKPVAAFCNPWPLAERFEAVLRVFNDRTIYAKRMARRLARAPRLAGLIFIAALAASAPGGDLYTATTPQADLATEHFNPPRV